MKELPCGENKSWTDCGYEYDCDYGFDESCENCVCCGGDCDPRYPFNKQPKKLSKFIIHTQEVNEERLRKEFVMRVDKDLIISIVREAEEAESPELKAARQLWMLSVTEKELFEMRDEMVVPDSIFINIAGFLRDFQKGIKH